MEAPESSNEPTYEELRERLVRLKREVQAVTARSRMKDRLLLIIDGKPLPEEQIN
ncbi:MAG: hypothetical protein KDB18_09135 [Salinibacterium sp.]|nr:hypothetical protein [Salinibacterium sp.]